MAIIKKIQVGDTLYDVRDNLDYLRRHYKSTDVTGVAGTSTTKLSTTFDVTDSGITEYYDGLMISFTLPCASVSTYGSVFQINNLGYKPIVYNINSYLDTRYGAGATVIMVYNSSQTGPAYLTKNTETTVEGCWQIMDYDTTNIYQLKKNNSLYKGTTVCYRYRLLFTSVDGEKLIPINSSTSTSATETKNSPTTTKFNPFGPIFEYHTTTAYTDTTTDMAASALYEQVAFDLRYSYYNGSAYLTTNKEVYIKATPNDDGSARLISNANPFVQSLPDEEDGYIYIYLGHSYSTTNIELHPFHPVFWYKGGRIVPYTADYVEQHGVAQLKGLVIDAQTSGEGGYEGGEISLSAPGDSRYTHEANLDVYMNTFRIHSQGTVPFSIDLTNGYVYSNNTNRLAYTYEIPYYTSQLNNDAGFITSTSLAGYATQSWVNSQGYLTSHQDISGKLDKSGGTMTGDLFYKAMGSNPSSGAINGGFYFHNSNSANTSSYCFGLYQWGDVFQFTSRTKDSTAGGTYRATAFEINGNTGKTDFKQAPSVNGTNVALVNAIPTTTSQLINNSSFVVGDSNVANIVVLTQVQYNALSTKSSTTLYLIRE